MIDPEKLKALKIKTDHGLQSAIGLIESVPKGVLFEHIVNNMTVEQIQVLMSKQTIYN
jgi:hypothetical protein